MSRPVFISHSSADRATAEAICAAVEASGPACWIAPRDIEAGSEWAEAISAAIAGAWLVLLVHSASAADSPMVRREINLAASSRTLILVVRIDTAVPTQAMLFYLGNTQWFDAASAPLGTYLPGIAQTVRRCLSEPSGSAEAGFPPPQQIVRAAFDDRPTIAVLPFRQQGVPEDMGHLADSLTEELIVLISSWRSFPVIARNSAFAYRNSDVDIRQIGAALGARYIISGHVRLSDGALTIRTELADAASGTVLMSETFKRTPDHPERLHEDIALAIAGVLRPEVGRQEFDRAAQRPRADATAYDLVWKGQWHRQSGTRADLEAAEARFRAALDRQPAYARALTGLALSRNFAGIMRWTDDVAGAFRQSPLIV